jgi:guanosine-3',5'-bis(diphosphate) 3'-pyrophosphohydrolase
MDHKLLLKAIDFAAYKHRFQKRKDEESTPYINHPIRVAMTLVEAGEEDIQLLLAAILHDTIEDTETTAEEIRREFGDEVCSIVLEVTDDKSLPKEVRKQLQIENAPRKSAKAKKLKYADLICNLSDIFEHPPKTWSHEYKRQYFDWAKKIGIGLGDVNVILKEKLQELIAKGEEIFVGEPLG